jgi:hypothetical protein
MSERLEEMLIAIRDLNAGVWPKTLVDWLRTAGNAKLSVMFADCPSCVLSRGEGGTILIDRQSDEITAMKTIAHEIVEHLLTQRNHQIAAEVSESYMTTTLPAPAQSKPRRRSGRTSYSKELSAA